MTSAFRKTALAALGAGAMAFGMLWSGQFAMTSKAPLLSTAQAIIGRPLTPLSYAGVARRTTRRAVVAGAAVGAAAVAPGYYPPPVYYGRPGCVQAVNAYGQVFYRCP